ncbi:MAG TPA: regulatory protein RecX [Vicinamibacterales bacterium]|nr:regulatory protein RecX [Vicinamibacterales bacterium]
MGTRRAAGDATVSPPSGSPRAAALRLLGRRDYTVAELTTRLEARGYPTTAVAAVVASLVAEGLADDRRTALSHIRVARDVKGRGRVRIARELAARGLDADLVAAVMADQADDDERTALERLLTRKRLPARLSMIERRRLFQHLLRRGFPADLIADTLRRRT